MDIWGVLPQPVWAVLGILLALWLMLGSKKSLKRLRREDKRLTYELSVEKKKRELKKLQGEK